MSFQDYINLLKVGDKVIVKDKNNYYYATVNKITLTGIIKVTLNFNEFMQYSFDKNGKACGNNYSVSIVNKFDEAAMIQFALKQAKDNMNISLAGIVSFLESQKDNYTDKNNEIIINIQELLKEWQNKVVK